MVRFSVSIRAQISKLGAVSQKERGDLPKKILFLKPFRSASCFPLLWEVYSSIYPAPQLAMGTFYTQGSTGSYILSDRVIYLVAFICSGSLYSIFSSQSYNSVLCSYKGLKTQWRNNSTIGPNNGSHLLILSGLSLPSVATKPEIKSRFPRFPKRYVVSTNYCWNNSNVYIS